MTDRAVPAWRYAIAGSLAVAIGLAAMLWFGQRGDGAPGAGTRASAAVPVERAATVVTDPPAGAFTPAAQALPAPSASAPPSPAQVHEMFTAAVRKAREAPAATPLPGIAKARSFEEAFQAMRAAEPASPSPGAGAAAQSPFGAVR